MAKKNEIVKVDTAAGSRSYNRLDMQVSQTLHMAIELYDSVGRRIDSGGYGGLFTA